MKESKYGFLVCSLCLLLAVSAPAFGEQKQDKSKKPQVGLLTQDQVKAKQAAAKREQLNLELFAAVDNQSIRQTIKLLAAGAKVNAKDRDGMTPLMHAALLGNPEMTGMLLKKGASVNMADTFGVTALMQASWANHTQIIEILLAAGADPNLQSLLDLPTLKKAGVTALMGASMNGNMEAAKILITRESFINQQDAQGMTALMHASKGGYCQIVQLLLSKGAQTETKDQLGRTALTLGTIYGHFEVVCTLVSAGANVNTKDANDKKPIVYASALDQGEIYKFLETAMARNPRPAQSKGCLTTP